MRTLGSEYNSLWNPEEGWPIPERSSQISPRLLKRQFSPSWRSIVGIEIKCFLFYSELFPNEILMSASKYNIKNIMKKPYLGENLVLSLFRPKGAFFHLWVFRIFQKHSNFWEPCNRRIVGKRIPPERVQSRYKISPETLHRHPLPATGVFVDQNSTALRIHYVITVRLHETSAFKKTVFIN